MVAWPSSNLITNRAYPDRVFTMGMLPKRVSHDDAADHLRSHRVTELSPLLSGIQRTTATAFQLTCRFSDADVFDWGPAMLRFATPPSGTKYCNVQRKPRVAMSV